MRYISLDISKFRGPKSHLIINSQSQQTIINVDKKSYFDEYLRMQNMNNNKVLINNTGSEEILLSLLLIYHPGAR